MLYVRACVLVVRVNKNLVTARARARARGRSKATPHTDGRATHNNKHATLVNLLDRFVAVCSALRHLDRKHTRARKAPRAVPGQAAEALKRGAARRQMAATP